MTLQMTWRQRFTGCPGTGNGCSSGVKPMVTAVDLTLQPSAGQFQETLSSPLAVS